MEFNKVTNKNKKKSKKIFVTKNFIYYNCLVN